MSRFRLQPRPDKQSGGWRLNVPASISPTGKRQRLFFAQHWQALAAAKSFRKHYNEFGLSSVALSPSRRIESAECWQLLDEVCAPGVREAPPGSMREIILKAVKASKEASKSITLGELFDLYIEKAERTNKTKGYLQQIGYARKAVDFWIDTKLPEITPGNIEFCLQKFSSGARNAHLLVLRSVLNYAIKKDFLSKNPAAQVEFAIRPKTEIRPLEHELVAAMLRHAAAHEIELLPYLVIGFFCGCREAELTKLLWSDIILEDKQVMVRPEVSKTRRKRFPPIPPNAMEWLTVYLEKSNLKPTSDLLIIGAYTLTTLCNARKRNFAAAGGVGHIPPNTKRITFATNFISAYQDSIDRLALILGHTSAATSFAHYASGVPQSVGRAYFEISPYQVP